MVKKLARIANVGGDGLGEDKGAILWSPNVSFATPGKSRRSSPTQEHVKILAKLPSKLITTTTTKIAKATVHDNMIHDKHV